MHFSIPDTQELNEGSGSSFTGYNLHINGVFHCTIRYKQLHNLNEQLKKEFGNDRVPSFPPKKLLPLTTGQLEERRVLLEKYIQSVGQDGKLVSSELVHGFLLSAQQETANVEKQDVNIDVYLMNTYQIKIRISTYDCTDKMLVKALKQINLPIEYIQYFSLYLIKIDNNGSDIVVVRKLLDFESPYITLHTIKSPIKIVIRKNYWDLSFDKELMTDPVALNLLYIQTVADVERGWIVTIGDMRQQLDKLKQRLAKKDYIEQAEKLKYYGFMQFSSCFCDYPEPQTRVLVAIGDEELRVRISGAGNVVKEGVFKVTRMKCWRITATNNNKRPYIDNPTSQYGSNSQSLKSNLELSFEYLMSKDNLQWITITSDQAIFMSICLQSLVDELLMKKNGLGKRDTVKSYRKFTYMKRDGSCQFITPSNSLDDDDDDENDEHVDDQDGFGRSNLEEPFSIQSLQKKFQSVSFKNGREFIAMNHAFEGIGDDDL